MSKTTHIHTYYSRAHPFWACAFYTLGFSALIIIAGKLEKLLDAVNSISCG